MFGGDSLSDALAPYALALFILAFLSLAGNWYQYSTAQAAKDNKVEGAGCYGVHNRVYDGGSSNRYASVASDGNPGGPSGTHSVRGIPLETVYNCDNRSGFSSSSGEAPVFWNIGLVDDTRKTRRRAEGGYTVQTEKATRIDDDGNVVFIMKDELDKHGKRTGERVHQMISYLVDSKGKRTGVIPQHSMPMGADTHKNVGSVKDGKWYKDGMTSGGYKDIDGAGISNPEGIYERFVNY